LLPVKEQAKMKLIIILTILFGNLCINAQEFYLKSNLLYKNRLINNDDMQVAPIPQIQIPPTAGVSPPIYSGVGTFPNISEGVNWGVGFGLKVNSVISFELEIDFLKNDYQQNLKSYSFKNYLGLPTDHSTLVNNWEYAYFNFTPSILFTKHINTHACSFKLGIILNKTELEQLYKKSSQKSMLISLDDSYNLGFDLGVRYTKAINNFISLCCDVGYEMLYYSPKSGKLIDYNTTKEYNLEYVSSLDNSMASSKTAIYMHDKKLSINSFYAGVNIQFNIN
jgi:hypothetical protein